MILFGDESPSQPLRQRSARISDHQILSMQPTAGVIKVFGMGSSIKISIIADDDQQFTRLLPDLYDARLVTMHSNGMLFFGLERTADPASAQYAQEWSVKKVAL